MMGKQRYVVRGFIDIDLVIEADSYEEAADSIPCNVCAQSVWLESEPIDDRLVVVDNCCFCGASILGNAKGTYYSGIAVPENIPIPNYIKMRDGIDPCCKSCAKERNLI